jgi:hypothetical protein
VKQRTYPSLNTNKGTLSFSEDQQGIKNRFVCHESRLGKGGIT